MCQACVCMTGASRRKRAPRPAGEAKKASTGWNIPDKSPFAEFEVPYGNIGANVGYAMIANRYLHEYEATPEQLAKVAVHQRDNACQNPDAIFNGQPITDRRRARLTDGRRPAPPAGDRHARRWGAALVVVGPELADKLNQPPAWLLGAGEQSPTRPSPTPRA